MCIRTLHVRCECIIYVSVCVCVTVQFLAAINQTSPQKLDPVGLELLQLPIASRRHCEGAAA